MGTYILNKYLAAKFQIDPKQYNVLIRITSPSEEFLPLEHPECFSDKLELKFYDFADDSTGLHIFNENHLHKVINFFEKHKNCQNMIIHCEEGISRSAGIAVGWFLFKDNRASIYNIYHDKKHMPNRLIVEHFYKYFNKSMSTIEKWEKEKYGQ
jgi:predicted protein tyrosine phosphatase